MKGRSIDWDELCEYVADVERYCSGLTVNWEIAFLDKTQ